MGKSHREVKSRDRKKCMDLLPKRNLHRKLLDNEREEEFNDPKFKHLWNRLTDEMKTYD